MEHSILSCPFILHITVQDSTMGAMSIPQPRAPRRDAAENREAIILAAAAALTRTVTKPYLREGCPCLEIEFLPLDSIQRLGRRRFFRARIKHLLQGRAWVDTEDYGVVHIEGRPAETLSFWIGKPVIIQDFEKLSGFWFAARRHSVTNGILTGLSELTVEYSDYQIRLKPSDAH